MIHALEDVLTESSVLGTEITVRCRIKDGPTESARGGEKTLYGLDVQNVQFDGTALLSFWHDDPGWFDGLKQTPAAVRSPIEDVPLREGEEVLVRGIPREYAQDSKWYLNVTSLLVRNPDVPIGKSEMRQANECPRIYDLAFAKNTYHPGRYDLSPGAIKGKIVHRVLERAIEDETFRDRFDDGWTEQQIEECFEQTLEEDFSIELALCRLAWVSPNQIKEHAWDALVPLFQSDRLAETIATADNCQAERTLTDTVGFNGRVDLVVDGRPYDLKTNYFLDDYQPEQHAFQLRVYLLALLLERLDDGESLSDHLERGVSGFLVYPHLSGHDGVRFEEVSLTWEHVGEILQLRNEAVTLRDAFGVPTTYNRDCDGCQFKEETTIGSGETKTTLPSPCKFYCQSERRWDCYETDESGAVTSQCNLFDECEQRLDFRDPRVTDHYNRLRTALHDERAVRNAAGSELDRLDPQTLTDAGLRVPGLQIEQLQGKRRLVYASEEPVIPSFTPGDTVRITETATNMSRQATYIARDGDSFVFELRETPDATFINPASTFEATRTLETDSLPRELLSQLDYAQRSGVSPLMEKDGQAEDAIITTSASEFDDLVDPLTYKEVYVDVPVHTDRTAIVTDLVQTVTQAHVEKPDGDGPVDEDEQRTLVLTSDPSLGDVITETLPDESSVRMDGFAGTDNAITGESSGHDIYQSIADCSVLVSSTQYALSERVFHAMTSGDEEARTHTDRFFDTVVIAGAETITEPQFHYLQILADRVVAIGDARSHGPELVSESAREEGLDEPYFVRSLRRFARIESESALSVRLPGSASNAVQPLLENYEGSFNWIEGSLTFENVSGENASSLRETTITRSIPCNGDEPRRLRLRPVDEVDAIQVSRQLSNLRNLNADELRVGQTYTVQDIRFEIVTNAASDGDAHEMTVNIPLSATPYLAPRLLFNEAEAERVVDLCADSQPDIVITPYAAQANKIRTRLTEASIDVPVRLPRELTGEPVDDAVLSLVAANEEHSVPTPLDDPDYLYHIMTGARNLRIVGNKPTLSRQSAFELLLGE